MPRSVPALSPVQLEVTVLTIGTAIVAFIIWSKRRGSSSSASAEACSSSKNAEHRAKNEEMKRSRLELLKTTTETVHIISTPFSSEEGRALAQRVADYSEPKDCEHTGVKKAFCYNPNEDCPQTIGGAGWLDPWMAICDNTVMTGGKVFVIFRSDGKGTYGCPTKGPRSLDGQAQPGEVRYALSKGCAIHWMDQKDPEVAMLTLEPVDQLSQLALDHGSPSPLLRPKLHGVPPVPELHEQRPDMHSTLCRALLSDMGASALSLTATGLVGTAGLGKTTAATCLAHDIHIQSRFPDGIVWLVFGQSREALSNLRQLGHVLGVRRERLSEWLGVESACNELRPLLEGKKVLIVLDDVWEYKHQVKPFKDLLTSSNSGAPTPRNKLLLTTRVREVANLAGGLTELVHCDEAVALRMLAKYMEQPEIDLSADADAKRLVRMSGGLPIALEQWGVACRSQSPSSLVAELNEAKDAFELPKVDACGDYDYGNFFAGLEAQLTRLEGSEEAARRESARCYCMLAVFIEDDQVPLDIVRCLWSGAEQMMSAASATRVARSLEGEQLLRLTARDSKGSHLALLDLHRQYLAHRGRSALAGWHSLLLRRCGERLDFDEGQHDGPYDRSTSYWRSERGRTRFLHHLSAADFSEGGAELDPSDCYGDLAKVETLDLRYSEITPAGAAAIGRLCAVSTSITALYLTGNSTLCVSRGWYAHYLKVLDDEDKVPTATYSYEGIKALASGLRLNASLTIISIGSSALRDEGVAILCDALRESTVCKVKTLVLSQNRIGPDGAKAIAAVCNKSTSLAWLDLSDNLIFGYYIDYASELTNGDFTFTPEGPAAIANAMCSNGSLTCLKLENSNLSDAGVEALSMGLERNKNLVTLKLSSYVADGSSKIGLKGATALASAIAMCTSLTECDLRKNHLGVEGWTMIFDILRQSKITMWDLSGEKLGIKIAKPLAAYISVSTSLTSLNLSNNELYPNHEAQFSILIGDTSTTGAKVKAKEDICDELSVLQVFRDRDACLVGDPTGIQVIAEALKVAESLTYLNVSRNELDLTFPGVQQLRDAVKERAGFTLVMSATSKLDAINAAEVCDMEATVAQQVAVAAQPPPIEAKPVEAKPAEALPAETKPEEERKFVARTLMLGNPKEAALGLKTALGLTSKILAEALAKGEQAIIDEFEGPAARKEDRDNLHYVLRCKANMELPLHVQEQIKTGNYHGGELKPGDYDHGHDGMRLDDFLDHPSSKVANLERVHVLALRLYTTSSYTQLNNPLRQRQKPHPFAMTVYFLDEGLTKLKAVAATGSSFSEQEVTLWRGMANMLVLDEFKRVGGCELAAMSTSSSKKVAFSYAQSSTPLVFKYECKGMTRGCSIDFLSVYPGEEEFLYSPLTYIRYKGSSIEHGVNVVSVEPQRA